MTEIPELGVNLQSETMLRVTGRPKCAPTFGMGPKNNPCHAMVALAGLMGAIEN